MRVVPGDGGASDDDIDGDLSRTRTELEDEIDALRREMDARDAKRNARDERAGEKLEDAIEKTGAKLETLETEGSRARRGGPDRGEEKQALVVIRIIGRGGGGRGEGGRARAFGRARGARGRASARRRRAPKKPRRDDRPASASASHAPVVKLEDMPGFAAATGVAAGAPERGRDDGGGGGVGVFRRRARAWRNTGRGPPRRPVPLIRGGRFRRGNDRRRRGGDAAFARGGSLVARVARRAGRGRGLDDARDGEG